MSGSPDWPLPWPDRFGVFWQRTWPRLGPWLARQEDRLLADEIQATEIDRPVFVAGLPRSGSTILLQILASVPGFAAHCYADFPLIWTPYGWNWLRQRLPARAAQLVERSHRDRILVNRDSPEALDEPLWQHYFPALHQEQQSDILGAEVSNPAFEQFFRAHLAKLVHVRNAGRYVAKSNYGMQRLGYLGRLFPDARFAVPYRAPRAHLASLLKQERLYADAPDQVLQHIAGIGHHEFGRQRRILHLGDSGLLEQIRAEFAAGNLPQAWLRIWTHSYEQMLASLDIGASLSNRVLLLDYDRLCAHPAQVLAELFEHCAVEPAQRSKLCTYWQSQLSAPDYYDPQLPDSIDGELLARADAVHARLQQ